MSQTRAAATAAATAHDDGRGAERLLRRASASAALRLASLALDQRLLEQALGPRELEREDRQADRDHHERRPGQREHRDPGAAGRPRRRRRTPSGRAARAACAPPGARAACGRARGSRGAQAVRARGLRSSPNGSRSRCDLEPDAEAAVALDAPAVRQAVEQHEAVAARGARRRAARARAASKPSPGSRQAHAHAVGLHVGLHRRARRSRRSPRGGRCWWPARTRAARRRPAGAGAARRASSSRTARRATRAAVAPPRNRANRHQITRLPGARARRTGRWSQTPTSLQRTVQPLRSARCRSRSASRSTSHGRTLSLSNLDKVLYPEAGFTKGHVIDYYTRDRARAAAAPARPRADAQALPERRRGAVLLREERARRTGPTGCATATIPIRTRRPHDRLLLAEDLPTLVWLANLADLELHTSLRDGARPARADDPRLRPRPRAAGDDRRVRARGARAARGVRAPRAAGFPKTSGSKGMQVYVPLNTPAPTTQTQARSRRRSRSCWSAATPSSWSRR